MRGGLARWRACRCKCPLPPAPPPCAREGSRRALSLPPRTGEGLGAGDSSHHHLGSLAQRHGRLNESESRRGCSRGSGSGASTSGQSSPPTAAAEAARRLAGEMAGRAESALARPGPQERDRRRAGRRVGPRGDRARRRPPGDGPRASARRPRSKDCWCRSSCEGGVETILGFIRDPQVGPAILVGAGGIAAEIYEDVVLRLPPISAPEAVADDPAAALLPAAGRLPGPPALRP